MPTWTRSRTRSRSDPRDALRDAYAALAAARSRFEEATDWDAVDAAIFEMAALERQIRRLHRLCASGVSLT